MGQRDRRVKDINNSQSLLTNILVLKSVGCEEIVSLEKAEVLPSRDRQVSGPNLRLGRGRGFRRLLIPVPQPLWLGREKNKNREAVFLKSISRKYPEFELNLEVNLKWIKGSKIFFWLRVGKP